MTYWVIACFLNDQEKAIYMAADVRVSRQEQSNLTVNSPFRVYADQSKKLFTLGYTGVHRINVGLCTSGYASGGPSGCPSISEIIDDFFLTTSNNKTVFSSGYDFVEKFLLYIGTKYTVKFRDSDGVATNIGQFILKKTNFGVGMFIDDIPFIASWDGEKIATHDEGYLEADFSGACREALHPKNNNIGLNILNSYVDDKERLDFILHIITIAARTPVIHENAAQSISTNANYAIIRNDNIIHKIILETEQKTNLDQAQFQHSSAVGTDRDFQKGPSHVPSSHIDLEDALRKGLT